MCVDIICHPTGENRKFEDNINERKLLTDVYSLEFVQITNYKGLIMYTGYLSSYILKKETNKIKTWCIAFLDNSINTLSLL